MPDPRPLQTSANDPTQIAHAGRTEKRRLAAYRAALAEIMATAAGRLVLEQLLKRAGVFHSIWHPSAAIHYNAGRQDFGHELMADLLAADEDLYQLMEREARARARREDLETEAAHTPPATEDRGVRDGR